MIGATPTKTAYVVDTTQPAEVSVETTNAYWPGLNSWEKRVGAVASAVDSDVPSPQSTLTDVVEGSAPPDNVNEKSNWAKTNPPQ